MDIDHHIHMVIKPCRKLRYYCLATISLDK
jgi:hypothetical protein